MPLLTVNGVIIPGITSHSVTRSDLDSENTTRNTSGYLLRERIRAGIYRIDVTCRLRKADCEKLDAALAPDEVTVKFMAPGKSGMVTAQMYAGDRKAQTVAYLSDSRVNESWYDYSFALIEY